MVAASILRIILEPADYTGNAAPADHPRVFGRRHSHTKNSARVTADALDALGRTEEAKALRERYGVTSSDDPKPS
jgi:hypothetical protein